VARPDAVHFYHLWLGGEWRRIAEEHFKALRDASFPGQVLLGLVGSPEVRAAARSWLPYEIAVEADAGFEDVTINALRSVIKALSGDTAVLYAHNKGTFHQIAENHAWRRAMDDYLTVRWADRVGELQGHDVAAWHWICPGTLDPFGNPVSHAHASGNFWWARADYLKGLPELSSLTVDTRIEAEWWIGTDEPHVAYAADTWPRLELARQWPKYVNGMFTGHAYMWLGDDGVWYYRP